MELTRRQDGSKNSWISEAGESTEQDPEMEGGKTLLVTQIGKESFWLRLLMMMASIFPVYPTSKSRWKSTQIVYARDLGSKHNSYIPQFKV